MAPAEAAEAAESAAGAAAAAEAAANAALEVKKRKAARLADMSGSGEAESSKDEFRVIFWFSHRHVSKSLVNKSHSFCFLSSLSGDPESEGDTGKCENGGGVNDCRKRQRSDATSSSSWIREGRLPRARTGLVCVLVFCAQNVLVSIRMFLASPPSLSCVFRGVYLVFNCGPHL